LAACGKGGGRLDSGGDPAAPAPRFESLEVAVGEIEGYPVPDGVDPAVFDSLKAELVRQLEELSQGTGRIIAAAPTGQNGRVTDLAVDPISGNASWTYVNTGDYDANGEVGVADITPIALNFQADADDGQGDDAKESWVDGDGNGEVGVSDITPIALNFLSMVASYRIVTSDSVTGPWTELATVPFGDRLEGYPVRFDVELLTAPNRYIAVVPYDAEGVAGETSAPLDTTLDPGDPIVSVEVTPPAPMVGDTLTVTVTATDPDGGALTYDYSDDSEYYGEFAGTGASVTWSAAYNGDYLILVTVSDDNGGENSVPTPVSVGITLPEPAAGYVGSSTCLGCHGGSIDAGLYEQHRHRHKLNPPTSEFIGPWWTGTQTVSKDGATADITMLENGGVYEAEMGGVTFPIHRAMGWGIDKWKQRYTVKNGNSIYILPIQYNVTPAAWAGAGYNLADWADTGGLLMNGPFGLGAGRAASFDRRCTGCHTTGATTIFNDVTGEWLAAWKEDNIHCEACHGPGAAHAASMNKADIIHPANDLDFAREVEVCGSCHGRGESTGTLGTKKMGYPFKDGEGIFQPGDTLSEFYTQTTDPKEFWNDGADTASSHSLGHHQQYNDYLQSRHYELQMACTTCHNPHVPDAPFENSNCTSCHANLANETNFVNHSHHSSSVPKCIDCHMPLIAKSAIAYDVRAHTFDIISPQQSKDMLDGGATAIIPNSCMNGSCHGGNAALTDPVAVGNKLADFENWWPGFGG
jgi:hypothetical protein